MSDKVKFLKEKIKELAFKNVTETDSLVHSKVLDSISVVDLAVAIEEEYGIKIQHTEIIPENFESIIHILKFLSTRGINE